MNYSGSGFVPDPNPSLVIKAYLQTVKKHLTIYANKNIPSTVLQYYSPKSSNLKIINKIFNLSALSFLLDPDREQMILHQDLGKSSGSDQIHNTVYLLTICAPNAPKTEHSILIPAS